MKLKKYSNLLRQPLYVAFPLDNSDSTSHVNPLQIPAMNLTKMPQQAASREESVVARVTFYTEILSESCWKYREIRAIRNRLNG